MTGSGTLLDPYVIWDVDDLQDMSLDLTAYYELGQDIDASATVGWNAGLGFNPVGPTMTNAFIGQFDGKGYKITELFIDRTSGIGLFDSCNGAVIQNVGLEDVDISGAAGYYNIGALAGSIRNTTVTSCYSTGSVAGTLSVGGLIGGLSLIGSTITNCYSTVNITGLHKASVPLNSHTIGGLIGGDFIGVISKCYATGDISAPNHYRVGGLVGENSGTITDCYARGDVDGDDKLGGLVGLNSGTMDNCYSTGLITGNTDVGGLVGDNTGTTTDSFWDTETSGMLISDGGTGKITTEMKNSATFIGVGWGFGTIWGMTGACNDGYACLLDVTLSCAYTLWKGNINIDQLIYQHAERMRV